MPNNFFLHYKTHHTFLGKLDKFGTIKIIFQYFMDKKVQGGIRCPPLVHVGLKRRLFGQIKQKLSVFTVLNTFQPKLLEKSCSVERVESFEKKNCHMSNLDL